VVQALVSLDVGAAFAGGIAIVVMAIVLDRVTTAVGARFEIRHRSRTPTAQRRRRTGTLLAVALTGIAGYLSHTFVWAAEFPGTTTGSAGRQSRGLFGGHIIDWVDRGDDWSRQHLAGATGVVKDAVTYGVLNPIETLLGQSPWFLVAAVLLGLAWLMAGWRAAVVSGCGLGLLLGTGLWQATMATLASTLVATAIVTACGLVVGVWMGRDDRADRVVRPVLDACQVMPAFVYLVPCLGLFGATRFTAIVAAVIFAAPVSIKLIAEGIRGVPPSVVEAVVCLGATPWQVITKVQVPLTARALTLAVNQGLIYVLSMVVIGGLVGAGALGYLVVAGFSQGRLYGKGLAAGLAIVVLGMLLDRTTRAAARRAALVGCARTP
jgi:glycine betaine/proline transport system permease protein